MRVVHLITAFPIGGAESMLVDIINHQIEDIRITSIVLVIFNDLIDDDLLSTISKDVTIFRINRKKGSKSLLPFIRMNLIMYKINPDIIHIHNIDLVHFLFFPSKKILTVHNTGLSKKGWKRFDAIYSISKCVKEEWDSFHIPNSLLYNGIRVNDVKTKTSVNYPVVVRFVQVSRLYTKQKGQDILIDALGRLYMEGINNFSLTFVGDGVDKEYLESKVETYGLSDNVIFLGFKDRRWVYENLYKYDVFVQPSRFEGFGLTVAEACMAKCITVISNIEGPMEILNDGKYGVTFQNKDVEDLYRVLRNILTNRDFYKESIKRSTDAFFYVRENFDIKKTANAYTLEYTRLLEQSKGL